MGQLGLSQSTIAGILMRLEKKGLLARQADDKDARRSRIYLTEAGLAMDQALMQLAAQTEEVLLAGLDENEQAELNRLLQRVLENLQACRNSSRGGEET